MLEHIKRMFASIAKFFNKHESVVKPILVFTVAAVIIIPFFMTYGVYPLDAASVMFCHIVNFLFGFTISFSLMVAYLENSRTKSLGVNHVCHA